MKALTNCWLYYSSHPNKGQGLVSLVEIHLTYRQNGILTLYRGFFVDILYGLDVCLNSYALICIHVFPYTLIIKLVII